MTLFGLVFAPIVTVISVLLIAIPHKFGIWLMSLAQFLWFIEGCLTLHIGMICQSILLSIINIIAIINWKRKGIG